MITETVTTYGLLMVMQFASLEQCQDWATKLYGIQEEGGCFEQHKISVHAPSLPTIDRYIPTEEQINYGEKSGNN